MTQKSITEIEHPPYSRHLAPNDFWPFKIKSALKGRRFHDTEDIKKCDITERYSTTQIPKMFPTVGLSA
jgi:hypothetical protein